jgi:hypothetical protein
MIENGKVLPCYRQGTAAELPSLDINRIGRLEWWKFFYKGV